MITLKGMTWAHERGHDSIAEASRVWGRSHPDVAITWTARSLEAFGDQPLAALAAEFDLLVIDHPHVAEAASGGFLAPFAAERTPDVKDFIGRSQQSYSWRGACYGLAIDAAAQVSVHRPDLLDAPPRDWNDVLTLAAAGRVLWAAKPIDAYASLFTLCAGIAGTDVAVGGRFCEPEAFDAAWEILRLLVERVPAPCLAADPIRIAETLSVGDEYWYSPLGYGYTNYARAGYRSKLLSYGDIPIPPGAESPRGSMLGGAGLAVSSSSAHREAAQDFALWVASPETQTGVYFGAGGQPGHVAAWESERLDARAGGFFSATRRTLEAASLRPSHSEYMRLQNDASTAVWEALDSRADGVALRRRLDGMVDRMEMVKA